MPHAGALARTRGACGACLGPERQLPIQQVRPGRLACSEAARPQCRQASLGQRGSARAGGKGYCPRLALEEDRRRPLDATLPWERIGGGRPTVPSARPRVARTTRGVVPPARAGRVRQVGSFPGGRSPDMGSVGSRQRMGVRAASESLALSGGCPGVRRRSCAARAPRLAPHVRHWPAVVDRGVRPVARARHLTRHACSRPDDQPTDKERAGGWGCGSHTRPALAEGGGRAAAHRPIHPDLVVGLLQPHAEPSSE